VKSLPVAIYWIPGFRSNVRCAVGFTGKLVVGCGMVGIQLISLNFQPLRRCKRYCSFLPLVNALPPKFRDEGCTAWGVFDMCIVERFSSPAMSNLLVSN
jgi:hypothetical protein